MLEFFFERVKLQHGDVSHPYFTEMSEDMRHNVVGNKPRGWHRAGRWSALLHCVPPVSPTCSKSRWHQNVN